MGNFNQNDFVNVLATGTVDLASGNFTANAAGVIVSPDPTNTGNSPGETATGPGGDPFGALLIGNNSLGFFPLFPANASTGLGNSTPPTSITTFRTLGDIFGTPVSIPNGTVLSLRVNDSNAGDNSGAFQITTIPEPTSMALFGMTLVGAGTFAWRRRRQKAN